MKQPSIYYSKRCVERLLRLTSAHNVRKLIEENMKMVYLKQFLILDEKFIATNNKVQNNNQSTFSLLSIENSFFKA